MSNQDSQKRHWISGQRISCEPRKNSTLSSFMFFSGWEELGAELLTPSRYTSFFLFVWRKRRSWNCIPLLVSFLLCHRLNSDVYFVWQARTLSVWSKVWHGMQLHSLYEALFLLHQRKQWDEKRVKYKKEKMRSNKGIDRQESIWDSQRNKILPTSTQQNLVAWYARGEYELVREREKERTEERHQEKRQTLALFDWSQSSLSLFLILFLILFRSQDTFLSLAWCSYFKTRMPCNLLCLVTEILGVSRQIQYLTLLWVEAESCFPLKMKRVGWNELMLFSFHFRPLLPPSTTSSLFMSEWWFFSSLCHSSFFSSFFSYTTILLVVIVISFFTSLPVLPHHLHPLLK